MAMRKGRKQTKKKSGKRALPRKRSVKKKTGARKSTKAKKSKARKKASRGRSVGFSSKQIIGVVTHYFPHVQAAVVKLKKPLAVGDQIWIKGSTTDFRQQIESMQIDHVTLQQAKKGDEIGLKVRDRVREHDLVLIPS